MTDRQPDPLFDALRTRLADYGQEPPAPLWAGIRAQLRPPVARPWRRHRWAPALLLGLLLAVLGGAGWFWRRTAPAAEAGAIGPLGPSSRRAEAELNERTATAEPGTLAETASTETNAHGQMPRPRGASPTAAPAQQAAEATKLAQTAAAALLSSGPVPSTAIAPSARPGRGAFAGLSRGASLTASTGRRTRGRVKFQTVVGATALQIGRMKRPNRALDDRIFGVGSHDEPRFDLPVVPGDRPADTAGQARKLADGETATGAPTQGPLARSQSAVSTTIPADQTRAGSESVDQLTALVAGISSLATPLPPLQATPEAPRLSPALAPRRWALEVLAGPALTYRTSAPGLNDITAPNSVAIGTNASRFQASAQLTEERPTLGSGAQVLMRRTLNGRWGLSAGLGYQDYATDATYSVQSAATIGTNLPGPASPRSFTTVYTRHDSYRFLTVPVRLAYALGRPSDRLHYGLLAGAEAALYLNSSTGRADDGNAYRSLSVAVSGGLDLRYRLVPRWEVLAQPSATYFLNSITRPVSGYIPRQPFGVGALLGLCYGLR